MQFLAIPLDLALTLGCSGPCTVNKANFGAAIDACSEHIGEVRLGVRLSFRHKIENDAGALRGLSFSDRRLPGELEATRVVPSEAVELKREPDYP